jgi:hypothetical protein
VLIGRISQAAVLVFRRHHRPLNNAETLDHFQFRLLVHRFQLLIVCGFLHVKAGVVLELPDKKARGFLVLIALK